MNAYGGSLAGSGAGPAGDTSSSTAAATDSDVLAQTTSKRISLHNCIKTIPRALPPPKWKLALIITSAVYTTLVVNSLSGAMETMLAADMPLGLVLFISISHTVTLLTYAGLPLLMSVPFVNQWLRLKRRCEPIHMHPLHAALDQGLEVFAIKMKPKEVPQEVLDKISKLERRLDMLLGMNRTLQDEVSTIIQPPEPFTATGGGKDKDRGKGTDNKEEEEGCQVTPLVNKSIIQMVGSIESHHESQKRIGNDKDKDKDRTDRAAPLTMACRHYVKWEHQIDFENWSRRMDAEMKK